MANSGFFQAGPTVVKFQFYQLEAQEKPFLLNI